LEFEKYVEQSLRCHQDLERYGQPLSELDKVLYFRTGMAHHPNFKNLMAAIVGTDHVTSFQAIVEFTRRAMMINGVILTPARSESRRVAAAHIRGGGRSDKSNRDNNRKPGKSGKDNDKDKRSTNKSSKIPSSPVKI
jgi:hypothetical protein